MPGDVREVLIRSQERETVLTITERPCNQKTIADFVILVDGARSAAIGCSAIGPQ